MHKTLLHASAAERKASAEGAPGLERGRPAGVRHQSHQSGTAGLVSAPGTRPVPPAPIFALREPASDFIVAAGGHPVLPLRDADLAAVEAACANFPAALAFIPPEDATFAAAPVGKTADGAVAALGEESRPAAAIYAHLTGRKLLAGGTVADFRGARDLAVVLALTDRVDDELTGFLSERGRHAPVGLILGRDAGELRRKMLATAVAVLAEPQDLPHLVELHPSLDFGAVEGNGATLIGNAADGERLRQALSRGASLVSISGHGDGIDGDLGGGSVLCPADAAFRSSMRPRQPLCRMTGACHRLHTPIGSETFRSQTIAPARIAARALVWNTCIGWPARESFIDRNYGAGLRLAVSPAIGALVTTARIVVSPSDVTQRLAAHLLRGERIGPALAAHNGDPAIRATGHGLILFGDPRLRIAKAPPDAGGRAWADTAPEPAPPEPGPEDAAILRLLARLASGPAGRRISPQEALPPLARYLGETSLDGVWARNARHVRASEGEDLCPHCGTEATRYTIVLGMRSQFERRLLVCPRCEVAADTAADTGFSVAIARERLVLRGAFPRGAWSGAVLARRRWPQESVDMPWPADGDGRPLAAIDPRALLEDTPLALSVVFVAAGSVAVFARTIPAATIAPPLGEISDGEPSPAPTAAEASGAKNAEPPRRRGSALSLPAGSRVTTCAP